MGPSCQAGVGSRSVSAPSSDDGGGSRQKPSTTSPTTHSAAAASVTYALGSAFGATVG